MQITLDALLKGKQTSINNKEFLKTEEYVNPFLETMSKFTDNFIINVKTPSQVTLTNNIVDETYNRVWIQAVMPDNYTIDNHDEVYGLIYGLDVRKPVLKLYRGSLNRACLNLMTFDPSWLVTQELVPQEQAKYNIVSLMEKVSDIETKLRYMKSNTLSSALEDRHLLLGSMIDKSILFEQESLNGKVKISPACVVKAYNNVYNNTESPYYFRDQDVTIFDYYNSFTDIITKDKKDIVNKFEKTMIINNLFNL